MTKISIPHYTLSEELINSISHGIGAIFGIVALILMVIKSNTPIEYITTSIFGSFIIILYTISCIYHALSPKLTGKKVLRVIDHCNVYLLVLGTYLPISLLSINAPLSYILFSFVFIITIIGIIFTCISLDKYSKIEVICHLLNGWSIIIGLKDLITNISFIGTLILIFGGVCYSIGAILYKIGAKKKYMHSIFHFFTLSGTILHFIAIYVFVL